MAKSIRSKSKRKFRTILRSKVFAPIEEARLERLSAKQAKAASLLAAQRMSKPSHSLSIFHAFANGESDVISPDAVKVSMECEEDDEEEDDSRRGRSGRPHVSLEQSNDANMTTAPQSKADLAFLMLNRNQFKRKVRAAAAAKKKVLKKRLKQKQQW